jgi:hypothetical protein
MSGRAVSGLAPAQPVKVSAGDLGTITDRERPAKKYVMQNFKLKPMTKPKTLDSGPDEVLSRVLEAIIQINNSNSSHLSFEELYR